MFVEKRSDPDVFVEKGRILMCFLKKRSDPDVFVEKVGF